MKMRRRLVSLTCLFILLAIVRGHGVSAGDPFLLWDGSQPMLKAVDTKQALGKFGDLQAGNTSSGLPTIHCGELARRLVHP